MTIYVDRDGGFKTGFNQFGGSDNRITVSNDFIKTSGRREDAAGEFNAGYYILSNPLTDTDSFWFRVKFRTPTSWAMPDANGTHIIIGLFNKAITATSDNHQAAFYTQIIGGVNNRSGAYIVDDAGVQIGQDYATGLATDTVYIVTFSYNHSTETLTCQIKDEGGNVLATLTDNTITNTLLCNAFGTYSYAPTGAVDTYINIPLEILELKLNTGTSEEASLDNAADKIDASLQVRTYGQDAFTDLSDYIKSIKVRRRVNAATMATISLINNQDIIMDNFMPNTEVKVRLGPGRVTAHAQFWGYIPSRPEFANIVHIKGKDYTFTHDTLVTLYGEKERLIDPASVDVDDPDWNDYQSSEQEDMYKAQRYVAMNSDPFYEFRSNETSITIEAYDYITKLRESYISYDDITNVNAREIFAAISDLIDSLPGGDLAFAGGGSDPQTFVGDSLGDWQKRKKLLDDWVSKLEIDDFPNPPRRYFYYQSNMGTPTLVVRPRPNIITTPTVTATIEEGDLLKFTRSRHKSTIELPSDFFWLDIGDVLYIDVDDYELKGYYFIAEITYMVSTGVAKAMLVLDSVEYLL